MNVFVSVSIHVDRFFLKFHWCYAIEADVI